ncbi:MAG TPA: D-glycero-beta-D-manno-heptose-7-phosphate kinase [Pyrinomonadaceae bacterium]
MDSQHEFKHVSNDLLEIIDSFHRVVVLVVGDVMLDRYWWGSVHRISPEAPVPVVRLEHSTLAAGGAANVAANIAGLSARPLLVGLIGEDEGGRELPGVLGKAGVSPAHLWRLEGRATTLKTRIVAHNQHVVRIDHEHATPITEIESEQIGAKIIELMPSAHVVVLSDYAKGLLGNSLLRAVIAEARRLQMPVLVDPKGRDYGRYAGATMLTPNRFEAAHVCGMDASDQAATEAIGAQLLSQLEVNAFLITQGEDGMTLFRRDEEPLHLSALARDVYDVTGAGDTVISTLSLALGAGADLAAAARLANMAARLAVEQVGTTIITLEMLRRAIEESLATLSIEQKGEDQTERETVSVPSEVTHA